MKKIKINKMPLADIFYFIGTTIRRNKAIKKSSDKPLDKDVGVIKNALLLHPKSIELEVVDIKEETSDTKSFILKSDSLAYFKAGQYISIAVNVNDTLVTRAYSLSSSPKEYKSFYRLTIKRTPNGFVSNYLLDNIKIGDKLNSSGPLGTFYYDRLRDAKNVIAIAGGSGITPFISMAKAIVEGSEDFSLTILYGCKTSKDIILKDELDEIVSKTDKVKVIYVLSEEQNDNYEHGFITVDLINKYMKEKSSIFICGSKGLYTHLENELPKLNLESKYIRYEMMSSSLDLESEVAYPKEALNKTFKIKVHYGLEVYEIESKNSDTILVSLEKSHIFPPSRCRSGECGYCHSKLVSGKVYIPERNDYRRMGDITFNYIHPCVTYPLSDLEIIIPKA